MKQIALWIWQLPQNLIGLVLRLIYCRTLVRINHGIFKARNFPYGISLGNTIIVRSDMSVTVIRHELGHRRQSEILGPLYFFVIGIPGFLWACINKIFGLRNVYYRFYTEAWADKLAGIKRVKTVRSYTVNNTRRKER